MGAKRILGLYGIMLKMDAVYFLRNIGACAVSVATIMLAQASGILGMFFLAVKFEGMGGMSAYEVLFMMGMTTAANGLCELFFNYNVASISRRIGRGQLDHMLIQPVSLPLQILTSGFAPVSGSSSFASGILVCAFALAKLKKAVTPLWVLAFAGALLGVLALIMFLNFLVSTAAFYAPVACEEISMYAMDIALGMAAYPLSGMPGGIRALLMTVVPAGLMGWFPAMLLLGKAPLEVPFWYGYAFLCALGAAAVFAFRRGLAHYRRTGSFRYKAVGHRG